MCYVNKPLRFQNRENAIPCFAICLQIHKGVNRALNGGCLHCTKVGREIWQPSFPVLQIQLNCKQIVACNDATDAQFSADLVKANKTSLSSPAMLL